MPDGCVRKCSASGVFCDPYRQLPLPQTVHRQQLRQIIFRTGRQAPETTSEAAVLIDADTGAVLYDKGMNEYRYPASTTKLMTILLATRKQFTEGCCDFYRDRDP